MTDTVKLIIEIPKRVYNYIRKYEHIANSDILDIKDAVVNGTPLDSNDSDYAEAQAYFDGQAYGWEQGRKALIDDLKKEIRKNFSDNAYIHVPYVLSILANMDKSESEV